MDFIPLVWFFVAILLFGAEFLIPGFVIFFFGIGAIILSVLTFFLPPLQNNLSLQIILWLLSSLGSLAIFRRFFNKIFKGNIHRDSIEDDYVSRQALVIEPISRNKEGRVSYQGTTWKAITFDEKIKKGERVEILKKENLTLIVSKLE